MFGTWRWNVGFGIFGIALTVLFSIGSNPWSVIGLRSVYAFIAFFTLAFAVRALLAYVLRPPGIVNEEALLQQNSGSNLDLVTPDEGDDLNELLKSQLQGEPVAAAQAAAGRETVERSGADFRPLTPPKLVSAQDKGPDELVKAIRHLTGE